VATDEDLASGSDDIAQKAGRGLRWSLAATVATKVASFGMGLVLSRLLTPDDFGLYAIALAATGFVMHVNDVGLIAATVQWRGKLRDIAPTASTLALAFSLLVYGAFWVGAPAFADLAGNPTATPAIRLLTLLIVIDGITAIRVASLQRSFQQPKIAIANTVGVVLQIPVAIGLALHGAGAYSFVVGQLAQATLTGILIFTWARMPVQLGLDRRIAAALLRYGFPLAAGLGVEALLINADYVVVGKLLGATLLGYYLLAFNVSSWVANTLGTAIRYVSVAGFSRLSEQEGALSDGFRRSVGMLLTMVVPIVVIMGALAEPLIGVLYGPRWAPAAAALTFLMILALIRLLTGLSLDALMGVGATRSAFVVNAVWAAVLVPALIVGTLVDGIRGTAIAHVAVGIGVALPVSAIALRMAGVHLRPICTDALRPVIGGTLAAAVSMLVANLLGGQHPILQLIAGGIAGAAVYALIALSRDQRRQGVTALAGAVRPRSHTTTVPEGTG
jgi:O-antigen/teichoic acid export membrane protein